MGAPHKKITSFCQKTAFKLVCRSLSLVIVCAFLLVIWLCGRFNSIEDLLWDAKYVIFTASVFPFILTAYLTEKKWHNTIRAQFDLYESIRCEMKYYLHKLEFACGIESCCNDMLLHEITFAQFKINIPNQKPNTYKYQGNYYKEDIELVKRFGVSKYVQYITDDLYVFLSNKLCNITDDTIIGYDKYYTRDWFSWVLQLLKLFQYDLANINEENNEFYELLKKYIVRIASQCFVAVAGIRHPWRWDLKTDEKILKLLIRYGECVNNNDIAADWEFLVDNNSPT